MTTRFVRPLAVVLWTQYFVTQSGHASAQPPGDGALMPGAGSDTSSHPERPAQTSAPFAESRASDAGISLAICQKEPPAETGPISNAYVQELARKFAPDEVLRTGVMADYLVKELHGQLCVDATVRPVLEEFCTPLAGPNALMVLRNRFVVDLIRVLARVVPPGPRTTLPEGRVIFAIAKSLQRRANVDDYLRALILTSEWATRQNALPELCHKGDDWLVRAMAAATTPLDSATLLLAGLLPELSEQLGTPEAAALAAHESAALRLLSRMELVAARRRSLPSGVDSGGVLAAQMRAISEHDLVSYANQFAAELTPSRRMALRNLLVLLEYQAKVGRDSSRPAADLRNQLASFLTITKHAMAVISDTPLSLEVVEQCLDSVSEGSLVAMIRPWIAQATASTSLPTPDSEQLGHLLARLELVERFLKAPDNTSRWRVVRNSILGLGAWTDHIMLDLDLGAAAVDIPSGDYRLAADITLGWQTPTWGIMGSGTVRAFERTSRSSIENLDFYQGSGELWWSSSPFSNFRFDGRAELGAAIYDSDHLLNDVKYDETSVMGRAALLAGIRSESGWGALGLWLGGGGQFEAYNSLDFDSGVVEDRSTLRLQLKGRIRARVTLWPGILAFRANAEAVRFNITRMQYTSDTAAATRTLWTELDVSELSIVDLEVARFVGFVPAIFGGINFSRRTANSATDQAYTPVFGGGLRREWL